VHALQTLQQIPDETSGGFVWNDCPNPERRWEHRAPEQAAALHLSIFLL
jgi:hypothetical protein